MENVKLVIFDMDGLMFDTERLAVDSWVSIGKERGFDIKKEYILETIGLNDFDSAVVLKKHMGQEFPYEKISEYWHEYLTNLLEQGKVPEKQGLKELLDYIDEKGLKKAVATSTARARAERLLSNAEVLHRFDTIICGDEITKGKPEPEIFLTACSKLNISPKDAIVLEDSEMGLLAASRAGIRCILIPDLKQPSKENEALAYAKVKSLLEVMDIKF